MWEVLIVQILVLKKKTPVKVDVYNLFTQVKVNKFSTSDVFTN